LPTQQAFYESTARHPAYIGGYGSGKTHIACLKALALAVENSPLPGVLVEPTSSNLRDIAIPMFQELLENEFNPPVPYKLLYSPYPNLTLFPKSRNPAHIWLRSGDKPESLKGLNLAWAGVDEVARIRQEIWGVLTSRVRLAGSKRKQCFAVGTPEEYWLAEYWADDPEEGYELFQASSYENKYLSDEDLLSIRQAHSEEDLEWALGGKFVRGGKGRAYKAFVRATHHRTVSPFDPQGRERLLPALPLCLLCDFNIDPCVWLVAQHRGGMIYVADEIVLRDTDTPEMIGAFMEKYGRWLGNTIVFGDAAGKTRTTTASKSDYELMRAAGFRSFCVPRANPAVKDRVSAVNARLKSGDGTVRLFVHPECKMLTEDFEWVIWQPNTSVLDKKNPDRTHASDALGYLIHAAYPIRRPRPGPVRTATALKRRRK